MADEFTLNLSLNYEDSEDTSILAALVDKIMSISTKKFFHGKQSIGTSEEALQLGELSGSALGWFVGINRDATNYLELRSATGASNDIVKLPWGAGCVFHWGSDVTAPYAIANTAACQLEYWLWAV